MISLTSRLLVVLGAISLALAGCADADSGGAASSRCLPVAPSVVDAISAGLSISGGGSLRGVQAVKSDDFERVWFIAGDLQGSGLDGSNDIAVWGTNRNPNGSDSGLIYAVGGVANEFSSWGDGGTTAAGMRLSDDGGREAMQCVESALSG